MESIYAAVPGNRSLSDNGDYLAYIRDVLNNERSYATFKHHFAYNLILEHANIEHGFKYIEAIKRQSLYVYQNINSFRINDIIGNQEKDITGAPAIFDFPDIGRFSPSTLRYVKIAADIEKFFGKIEGNIAEIGGGYGGQCLILDQIFRWQKYYIFDLALPLQLTSKYLESFILNSSYQCTTLNQYTNDIPIELVISTVAFSELPSKLQLKYIEKVLSKAKRGYLVMNTGFEGSFFKGDFLTLAHLVELLPSFEVFPEDPQVATPNNKVIVWGHSK